MALSAGTTIKEQTTIILKEVTEQGIPWYCLTVVYRSILNCDKVIIDDKKGAYNASNQNLKTVAKRIAMILLRTILVLVGERAAGYRAALSDNGIGPTTKDLILGKFPSMTMMKR